MGGSSSQNANIPMEVVVKRIDDSVLPDDKDVAIDFLEILESKFEKKSTKPLQAKLFKQLNGIPIVMEVLRGLIKGLFA